MHMGWNAVGSGVDCGSLSPAGYRRGARGWVGAEIREAKSGEMGDAWMKCRRCCY